MAAGPGKAGHLVAKLAPAEVVAFVAATRAYQPAERLQHGEIIDRYAVRAALIALLDRERPWSEEEVDFPRLLRRAWSNTAAGRELRDLLRHPPAAVRARLQGARCPH